MRRLALAGALVALCAPALPATAAEEVCRFSDDRITESSGLVPAHRDDRVLFTHNDSGDEARFFAVDGRCRTLATYVLPGIDAVDWEDMASGPGPDGRQVLWFGDIGDNAMTRPEISVQRVAEPAPGRRGTEGGPVGPVSQLATTGGDVAPDGSRVVVRTYTDAYEWEVGEGGVLDALTLTAPYARTPLPPTTQGEAIGYGADSRTLWVSSEGAGAPVHRLRP